MGKSIDITNSTYYELVSYHMATLKAERVRDSIRNDFPNMKHSIISEEDAG